MERLYATYKKQAQFFLVYIKEAHPKEGWAIPVNGEFFEDPTTLLERKAIADTCVGKLDISIPTLIDEIDNQVADDYDAMPDRLYVVDTDGRIAFRGDQGPWGFQPGKMETRLREILGLPSEGRVLKEETGRQPRRRPNARRNRRPPNRGQ